MDVEALRLFAMVAREGGFTRAADKLRMPKSTVSRAVTRLEAELGQQLLFRSTRSLALTQAGEDLFQRCDQALITLESAFEAARTGAGLVEGLVRVTAPEDIGVIVVNPTVEELTRQFPRLRFELRYSEEFVDLVKEGFDFGVRIGKLPASALKSRKVGHTRFAFVASPEYLRRNPPIRSVADLAAHRALVFTPTAGSAQHPQWHGLDGGKAFTIPPQCVLLSNHARSLLELAIAGRGVSFLPDFVCAAAIADGSLARVLPQCASASFPVQVVYPGGKETSIRTRTLLDHLAARLSAVLQVGG